MRLDEYTNSELEEMGIPLQCECRSIYREVVDNDGNAEDVCVDCGASAPAGRIWAGAAW